METPRLPVQYSTFASAALGNWLLERFDLPAPLSCHYYKRGNNDTYFVAAAGEQYVLRIYRHGYREDVHVRTEVAVIEQARAGGVRTPQILKDRDGEAVQRLIAPEGERCALLFARASGQSVEQPHPDQAAAAGRELARFHLYSAGQETPAGLQLYDRAAFCERPLEQIEVFARRHKVAPSAIDYLAALSGRLEQWLAANAEGLPSGTLHGDVFPANVLFDEPDRAVLFDFDICGTGWLAFDVSIWPEWR